MKKAIGFFLFFASHAMTSPVPISVDLFSTQNFTGASSANGTSISLTNSATLNFQDQSNPGNASISVSNNSTVNFEETSSTTYSGQLTGSGSVNKTGSGDLTMTGNNSGFTGPLFVQTGTLFLSGAYGGSVTSAPAATIVYNGPITGDLNVTGTITTDGVTSLQVGGNYFQTANAVYIANINSAGQSSLINIAGTASINGFVQINALGGVLLNANYTILHANGGVLGTYRLINPYPLLLASITYDANNVYLSFKNNILSAAVTRNEKEVANQLDNLTPTTQDEINVISSLLTLTSSQAQDALNQLSGEQYSNFILSSLYDSGRFSKRIYNSFRDFFNPCAEPCKTIDNWASIGGGRGFQEGNRTAKGFNLSSWDFSTGMHACLCDDYLLGGALRYDRDSVHSGLGGKATLNTASAAIYSLTHKKQGYVFADLIGGTSWGDFKRDINFGSIKRFANSDPRLSYGRFDLQLGADVNNQYFSLQPYFGISAELYHQEKIKEHRAESLNLLIKPLTKKLASSQVGLHFGSGYNKKLSMIFDLAWLHYYGSLQVSEKIRFTDFGTSFPILGPKRGHDGAEGSFYLFKPFGKSSELFLGAEGELWKKWHSYEFNAGVCLRW